jgi:thiamine transport system ATP-binding protein
MSQGLELRELNIGYASTLITANLHVRDGITVILGPSGCGKSTLLSTILGSVPALGGSLLLNDIEITKTPIHARNIGMVFQDPLLFSHLTVLQNVMYGLRRLGMSKALATDKATELLEWVGLPGFETRSTQELSGGQAQRVALARALAPEPAALLLDEPYSSLDSELRTRLAIEVAELLRSRNVVAVHVTHDESEARSITSEIFRVSHASLKRVTN